MADEFIRINIAFKPPTDVAEAVAELSKEMSKKEDAYFIIDNLNFYAHITIYSPEYPDRNLNKILEDVENLSKNIHPIKLIFKEVKTTQGFAGVEFDYSDEIKYVHESIIEKLNPLREGRLREKYKNAYNMKFSGERMQNMQKYGYPNSMKFYHPHMTITRIKDEKAAEKIAKEINWPIKEFTIDKIGAYKMGENGTCIELIKEFKLG